MAYAMREAPVTSIVVIGKESVGKSELVGALTNRPPKSENFRGSTVRCETFRIDGHEFVDTPGILRQSDTLTTKMALSSLVNGDIVFLVLQATHLSQDLNDFLPLVVGKRCVIVVTFWDKVKANIGAAATVAKLSFEVGIPIIPVDARRIEKAQRQTILDAAENACVPRCTKVLLRPVWLIEPKSTVLEHRYIGPALAICLFLTPAVAAVGIANSFAGFADPIFKEFTGLFLPEFNGLPAVLKEVLIGDYGLVTMGPLLFVWAVPTVVLYALLLGCYKASGLLDRMSSAMHPLVSRVGLSGRDLVRIVMGFGCNVPAVISTRACSRCSRDTTIKTIAFGAACSYQFGATIGVFAAIGHPLLIAPFLTYLVLTTIIYTRLTSSRESRSQFNILVVGGRTFITWPHWKGIWREARSTLMSFFRTSIPIFFLISVIASLLNWLHVLYHVSAFIQPAMAAFHLPEQAALPIVLASIRKDGILLVAQMARGTALTRGQSLTAVYLAGELLPCLVTALTISRERSSIFVGKLMLRQALAACFFALLLAWGASAIGF